MLVGVLTFDYKLFMFCPASKSLLPTMNLMDQQMFNAYRTIPLTINCFNCNI